MKQSERICLEEAFASLPPLKEPMDIEKMRARVCEERAQRILAELRDEDYPADSDDASMQRNEIPRREHLP